MTAAAGRMAGPYAARRGNPSRQPLSHTRASPIALAGFWVPMQTRWPRKGFLRWERPSRADSCDHVGVGVAAVQQQDQLMSRDAFGPTAFCQASARQRWRRGDLGLGSRFRRRVIIWTTSLENQRPSKTISRLARPDPHTSATTTDVTPGEIPSTALVRRRR